MFGLIYIPNLPIIGNSNIGSNIPTEDSLKHIQNSKTLQNCLQMCEMARLY